VLVESFGILIAKLLLQGLLLVFSVAMEGGAVKLFDVRSYDKVSISIDVLIGPCSIYNF
jgi:hypothetical protein